MDTNNVLLHLAALESLLQRYNHSFSLTIGHYRRWLSKACPAEVELIRERLVALYGGEESLNSVQLEGKSSEDTKTANRSLQNYRDALWLQLQVQEFYTSEEFQVPEPVEIKAEPRARFFSRRWWRETFEVLFTGYGS